jgi:glycosyltransferase involved in cell wall biosynthesis
MRWSCSQAVIPKHRPTSILRLDGSVRDPNALHMAMLERVRQRAHDFDLLHFHLDYYPFSLFSRQPTPFVTTLHGRLDLPEHQVVFATFPSIPVISISDAQRRPVPGAGWIRTIHHGLPERLLTPQPATPAYFAFLGRISPEKAVDQANRDSQALWDPTEDRCQGRCRRPRLFRAVSSASIFSPRASPARSDGHHEGVHHFDLLKDA